MNTYNGHLVLSLVSMSVQQNNAQNYRYAQDNNQQTLPMSAVAPSSATTNVLSSDEH